MMTKSKRPVRRVLTTALGAALLLSVGCEPASLPRPDAAVKANLPAAKVDLPPIIKLEGSIPPETHPDHTMRIDGLLARKKKHLNHKIMVRGYLIEKHVKCPEEQKLCEKPHGWLADAPAGGDKKLMLVNLTEEVAEGLEIGQQYVATGEFSDRSSDGFVRSEGLLKFEKFQGDETPEDDKAPAPKKRRRGR